MPRKNRNKTSVRAQGAAGYGASVNAPEAAVPDGKGGLLLCAAAAFVCAGYFLLTKTDPAGSNIYSILSPALLLSGYLLVPAALFRKAGK